MRRSNALLQKVNSQLRGERVKKDDEEDDLNAYIKSLTQKTVQQKKNVNFEDIGDISISSELESSSHGAKKGPAPSTSSKFLKKKTNDPSSNVPQSKFLRKPQVSSASPVPTVSSQIRPGTSRGPAQRQTQSQPTGKGRGMPNTQQSSSLDRAAALSSKIQQRSNLARKALTLESDSDDTFTTPRSTTPQNNGRPGSASSDSFKVGKDGGRFMKKKPADPSPERPVEFKPEPGGKTSPVPKKKVKQDAKHPGKEQGKKGSPFMLKSSQKYSTDVVLSSEEESLAEFITGLDADSSEDAKIKEYMKKIKTSKDFKKRVPSPPPLRRTPSPDSKPPAIRRTPSPITPRRAASPKVNRRSPSPGFRRSRSSDDSLLSESLVSEVIPERDEDIHSISSGDDGALKFNIMDADSLEPYMFEIDSPVKSEPQERKSRDKKRQDRTPKKESKKKISFENKKDTKKGKKKETEDIFSTFGLQTVDDLLGGVSALDDKENISEASEIRTQSETSEIHTEKEEHVHVPVFGRKSKREPESVTEIVSEIRTPKQYSYTEDFEESITERIGVSTKSYPPVKSASEIRTRYSSETGDEYTEDFPSDTESIATVSKTSEIQSEKTISDSYTSYEDSYTYTRSYSTSPQRPPRSTKPTKSVEVQTAEPGLSYRWDNRYTGLGMTMPQFGLQFVDPTPIATHVVSPDSLEALTSYSPSMLALHDMLKQQLSLTQEFLQSQKIMYGSFISGIDPSYKYTTLEETKQYIRKNRKKRLTFKEALRMVDAEAGR